MNEDILQFATADNSEQGIELKLSRPDGTETDQFLKIIGKDSRKFRKIQSKYLSDRLEAVTKLEEGSDERADAAHDLRIQMLAECIVAWSFDTEFTPENVQDVLRKAPILAEQVDSAVADRTLFISGLTNS